MVIVQAIMEKSRLFQKEYSERKEHRFFSIVWRLVNAFVFPVIGNLGRKWLLRGFGARIVADIVVYPSAKIFAPWNLVVESPWAVIGPRVEIYNKAKVTLGGHAIISQDTYLCTASHDVTSPVMALVTRPIVVEADSWIAARAVVLPGVTIHEGGVVGCASVVTRDVAPWTVVGGNPAKFIKKRELRND